MPGPAAVAQAGTKDLGTHTHWWAKLPNTCVADDDDKRRFIEKGKERMINMVAEGVFAETDTRGCNAGFVITSEGVVMIDTPQLPTAAIRMRKLAESHGPIKYLINTEHHVDHIFGNYFFNGVGAVMSQAYVYDEFMVVYPEINPYEYAKEAIPTDDPEGAALFPDKDTYFKNMNRPNITFTGDATLRLGGLTFELIATPGHSPGLIAVYIPEKKLVFASDNIFNGVQTWHYSSNIPQWVESLQRLKKLDAEIIVPGHGPVCGADRIDAQKAILFEWQYRVADCVAKGLSVEECVKGMEIRDRFPVDIGQEYMLDHVIENNVRALYRKFS